MKELKKSCSLISMLLSILRNERAKKSCSLIFFSVSFISPLFRLSFLVERSSFFANQCRFLRLVEFLCGTTIAAEILDMGKE